MPYYRPCGGMLSSGDLYHGGRINAVQPRCNALGCRCEGHGVGSPVIGHVKLLHRAERIDVEGNLEAGSIAAHGLRDYPATLYICRARGRGGSFGEGVEFALGVIARVVCLAEILGHGVLDQSFIDSLIRIGVESWPPLLLASLRFLVAGSVLYAALRLTGTHAPTARQWRDAGVVGVLLLTVGNGAVSVAEKTVASGVAALAVATVPLFTAAFARLFGHRNTRWEWAGIVLGLLGMGLLNLGANLQASPQGAALLLLASVSWSFGSVWGEHLDLPSGGMASAGEMLVAGAGLLV